MDSAFFLLEPPRNGRRSENYRFHIGDSPSPTTTTTTNSIYDTCIFMMRKCVELVHTSTHTTYAGIFFFFFLHFCPFFSLSLAKIRESLSHSRFPFFCLFFLAVPSMAYFTLRTSTILRIALSSSHYTIPYILSFLPKKRQPPLLFFSLSLRTISFTKTCYTFYVA